ncbi:hypothetical protein PR048_025508 [Dryococelus australis]|uniref:Uncharacterized protein n=1 Tax=Dryococelus australis TaxID=614101 RepID=A0ABQ9GRK6_9NEOP|nr:hypothetical protein PR048_025508 [Dryococelus australis]
MFYIQTKMPHCDIIKGTKGGFVRTSQFRVRQNKSRIVNDKFNVKIMHSLFTHDNANMKVSYDYYLNIFKEDFCLAFGCPRVDTLCYEELSVKLKSMFLNDAAKRTIDAEKHVNLRQINFTPIFRKEKALRKG